MTIRTQAYRPDTCGCVIEESYDDTLPLADIVVTQSNYFVTCSAHSGLADNDTKYATVIEESSRKNRAIQLIIDNSPASMENVVFIYQADGVTRVLKKGVMFFFALSGTAPNRVITITYTGFTLTNAQKNTAQGWLDNRFGSGKVIIA